MKIYIPFILSMLTAFLCTSCKNHEDELPNYHLDQANLEIVHSSGNKVMVINRGENPVLIECETRVRWKRIVKGGYQHLWNEFPLHRDVRLAPINVIESEELNFGFLSRCKIAASNEEIYCIIGVTCVGDDSNDATGAMIFWSEPIPLTKILGASGIDQPVDAVKRYIQAIESEDKDLLKASIHAPEQYKNSFSKIIDLKSRFAMMEYILAENGYKIEDKERKGFLEYTSPLDIDLLEREFKVSNDTAQSIPIKENEIPVSFKKIRGQWLIDLQQGLSDEQMNEQVEFLDARFEVAVPKFNYFGKIRSEELTYDQDLQIRFEPLKQIIEKAVQQKK